MDNKTIRIITRADDLGGQRSANRAIQEAYQTGMLRNAGIMSCAPFAEDAAQLLAKEEGICIGLHVATTSEWNIRRWGPVAGPDRVPSLVQEDGTFFRTIPELRENKPQLEHLYLELQAQLDRAHELGFDIRYGDWHMGGSRLLKELAGPDAFDAWLEARGIIAGERFRHRIRPADDLPSAADPIEALIHCLDQTEPGVYVLVGHPAYDDNEMREIHSARNQLGTVAQQRDWQRRYFCDPRILEYCQARGISAVRFDEVPVPS